MRLVFILIYLTISVYADNKHLWTEILYPNLQCNFANKVAQPRILKEKKGFKFTLSFSWPIGEEKKKQFLFPDTNKIHIQLHYADGTVVKPIESTFSDRVFAYFSNGKSTNGSLKCVFPWGKNEMQEAWIALKLEHKVYWLEVPYGFTRDPALEKLPNSIAGNPKLPKALKLSNKSNILVNWHNVHYLIGFIQNGWDLSLFQSNPLDASTELTLYRDDTAVGKSKYLWELHTPKTNVSITDLRGLKQNSRAISIRMHKDGKRRSDSFIFDRKLSTGNLRNWGTIIINVGETNRTIIIPSSLFRHRHGIAMPNHKITVK